MLAESGYGKSGVRLVKVTRHGDRHDLKDLSVAIRFEGDYAASYIEGDNSGVLPTDTMKNTVYALAASHPVDEPEPFALTLASHFLDRNPLLAQRAHRRHRARLGPADDRRPSRTARRSGVTAARRRSATVGAGRSGIRVGAGVHDLVILKSSHSAFTGFVRDEFTTLPPTTDRLLATSMTATWQYRDQEVEFGPVWRAVRTTLLETFAEHDSKSVQHTLYAMGQAVLDSLERVSAIRLVMPNKHHLPVDLSRLRAREPQRDLRCRPTSRTG